MEIVIQHLIWTTVIMTVIAFALVFLVVWIVHWLFPETPSRTPMAMAFVSIVIAAIFGVPLNNLFAIRRDRDSRDWNMRQQHLAQLRPVLKSESERLEALAHEIQTAGFLHGEHERVRTSEPEISTYLESDVMSFDLANHYPDYASTKNGLASELLFHDKRFVEAATEAAKEIGIHDIGWFSAQDLGISYVAHCAGRGPRAHRADCTGWPPSMGERRHCVCQQFQDAPCTAKLESNRWLEEPLRCGSQHHRSSASSMPPCSLPSLTVSLTVVRIGRMGEM